MRKVLRILLILVAVASFAVALSYPIQHELQKRSNQQTMERLAAIRDAGLQSGQTTMDGTQGAAATALPEREVASPAPGLQENAPQSANKYQETVGDTASVSAEEAETAAIPEAAGLSQNAKNAETAGAEPAQAAEASSGADESQGGAQLQTALETVAPQTSAAQSPSQGEAGAQQGEKTPEPTVKPTPSPTPVPTPTPDRTIRTGALTYDQLEKKTLDESKILPQYRELYALNNDMVGWLRIPGTKIDYPVVQCADSEYYLKHDFFGKEDKNGQIILDTLCDPYTPSYNMVISGHNMHSESMFSSLTSHFRQKIHWRENKIVLFDSLMEERTYVVIASFFSADYDEDEEGFRYNTDIRYRIDAEQWLAEIRQYQLYDTGIDAEFGDEFLTLTTCNSSQRKNGRFVVICRRIREGETIE